MPGLLRGVARTAVIAGTPTSVSNRVSRRQGQRWAAQEEQQQPQQAAPAAPAVPPGPGTPASNGVPPRQGKRGPAQEEQQQPQRPAPAAPAAAPARSTIDQLKELGELKAQGILTEEEFAAQKAKLLA